MRYTIKFERVKLQGTKHGKCTRCGKLRQRRKTFEQTINPWNKDEAGNVKTRAQILDELNLRRIAWAKEPITCCGEGAACGTS